MKSALLESTLAPLLFLLLSLPAHSDAVVIPFETLWEVDNNESVAIKTYNYASTRPKVTIDWGDGQTEKFISPQTRGLWENETSIKHTYINKGSYKVKIYFVDSPIRFDNQTALKAVLNWGNYGCFITHGIFQNSGLERVDAEGQPNCEIFTGMFYMAKSFNDDLNHWDMSAVTRISSMFYGAEKFNGNISSWDTSKVEYATSLFNNAKSFNSDISQWNTKNLANAEYLFSGASQLNQDLSNWDLTKLTDLDSLFYNAKSFKGPLPKFNFNDITYVRNAFYGVSSLKVDLSNWNTDHIRYCYHFVDLGDHKIILPSFKNCSIAGTK
ncbi:MAG: surface protein [Oleispira sp.]